jgi:endonuclease/exonuclease/phosphatase family metal-dependent hydrolase
MRVATYNIASGGFTNYDSTARQPERLELLQKAIRTIDADILGLTDTFRWKDIFTSRQIEQLFDYPYSYHINMNDTRVDKRIGVAILSRSPIITHEAIRLHNRDAIKVTVRLANTDRLLKVFVVYLDDLSELTRQKQVQDAVTYLSGAEPTIIMGDFNAVWPQHVPQVKRQVDDFLVSHPEFMQRDDYEAVKFTFDNFYAATILPNLAEHGLIEALELRPTAITPLHPLAMPTIFPVDHILGKNCTVSDYSVCKDALFDIASDHYPLMANLDLE